MSYNDINKDDKKYRKLNTERGVEFLETDLPEGWTKKELFYYIIRNPEEAISLDFIPLKFWKEKAEHLLINHSCKDVSLGDRIRMVKQACLDFIFGVNEIKDAKLSTKNLRDLAELEELTNKNSEKKL